VLCEARRARLLDYHHWLALIEYEHDHAFPIRPPSMFGILLNTAFGECRGHRTAPKPSAP
jgi:hypothetical protein